MPYFRLASVLRIILYSKSRLKETLQNIIINCKNRVELEYNFTYYQAANELDGDAIFLNTGNISKPVSISDSSGMRTAQIIQSRITQSGNGSDGMMWHLVKLATVPTIASTTDFFTPIMPKVILTQQPYVFSDCLETYSVNMTNATSQFVDFGANSAYLNGVFLFDPITGSFSQDNASSFTTKSTSDLDNHYSLLWSRPPAQALDISLVGIAATTTAPYNNSWTITTCVFSAYWATATSNGSNTDPLVNELPSSLEVDPGVIVSSLKEKALISLDPKWAERAFVLSTEIHDIGEMINFRFTKQALQYALALSYVAELPTVPFTEIYHGTAGTQLASTGPPNNMTDYQRTALTKYVDSNKLLKKFDRILTLTNQTDLGDPTTLARLETTYYSLGYGYDASSITVKMSLAVLTFYLIISTVYLVYTLITGNVATSWNTVAELTTLALNSQRPDDLKHTSVGVDTLETFRSPVNIRVNQENSLEIVFDATEKDEFIRVEPNWKY